MIIHHKGLTPEHWFKFSLAEQLANVGCENEYNMTMNTIQQTNAGRTTFINTTR